MRKLFPVRLSSIKNFTRSGAKKLSQYLRIQKRRGNLKGISSYDIKAFVEKAKKIVEKKRGIYGRDISPREMNKIIDQIRRETNDPINPREAEIIKKAIFGKK